MRLSAPHADIVLSARAEVGRRARRAASTVTCALRASGGGPTEDQALLAPTGCSRRERRWALGEGAAGLFVAVLSARGVRPPLLLEEERHASCLVGVSDTGGPLLSTETPIHTFDGDSSFSATSQAQRPLGESVQPLRGASSRSVRRIPRSPTPARAAAATARSMVMPKG